LDYRELSRETGELSERHGRAKLEKLQSCARDTAELSVESKELIGNSQIIIRIAAGLIL
jgi:hypothetical protein